MNKKLLRKIMREKRKSMEKKQKNILDKELREKLFDSEKYKNSKIIFVYVSIEEEINTIKIIKRAFSDEKTVTVPKIMKNGEMRALKINSLDELKIGYFNILEPNENAEDLSEIVDLTIVPGLAFDKKNKRLGYGGGFYDRFFEKYKNSFKISLCYDYQFVETVYAEKYDVSVDMIISNSYIVKKKDC